MGIGLLSNFNTGTVIPAINIKDADEFFLKIVVQGMKKSDFNIHSDHKILSISLEMREEHDEKNEKHTRRDFRYSTFKRTFTLPNTIASDKINTPYKMVC